MLSQSFHDYEYIVKDGKSTDDTMNLVYSLVGEDEQTQIVSCEDQGIYDAMNIAADMARGEYLFFLNAGDCFSDTEVLKNMNEYLQKSLADIAYGNVILLDKDIKIIKRYHPFSGRRGFFLTGDCICHQAIFAKRNLFTNKKFDVQYKVCADKEWELFHIVSKANMGYVDFEISVVPMDGYAREHVKELELETVSILKKYCKRTAWVYTFILLVKRNRFVLGTFHLIERAVFRKKL